MTSHSSPQRPRGPRRRTRASCLFGAALFAAVAVVGGATAGSAAANRPLVPPPGTETIRYQVNGSPGAAEYISYAIDYGQQYESTVPLPWTKQFTAPPGRVYVLSAQGSGTGSISCTIAIDGKVVSHVSSTATPARAACSH
ncbi:MmpS family transport accessory protein [Mycobacterium heckeshornense]|nr:MmpS family transport accessory protein [Mycobacterium heckeshornense]MCV7032828.1 hypothetical protein [Mycobacterium heckeshornense]